MLSKSFDFGKPEVAVRMRRQSKRPSVLISAILCTGNDRVPCRVRNISTGGVMAETNRTFARGQYVTIEMPQYGIFTGMIVWSHKGRVGISFDLPFSFGEKNTPANDESSNEVWHAASESQIANDQNLDTGGLDQPDRGGKGDFQRSRPSKLFGGKPLAPWVL